MLNKLFGTTDQEQETLKTTTVFKISGVPPHTYVERGDLSIEIDEHLESKDGILLFLGYSKSGKTVFRKKHVENQNYNIVTYRGNKASTISDLYGQIATQLNLGQPKELMQSTGTSTSRAEEEQLGNKNIGHVKDSRSSSLDSATEVKAELYPSKIDVNFLCHKLSESNVLIVIEDYHLVDNDFNLLLSEDLKHFLDEEIQFLLIGIPSSPNRALRYNPDLSGRMHKISFDYLTKKEIREIIDLGTGLLNVEMSEEVVDKIIDVSFKNAYLVQYICQKLLINIGVRQTSEATVKINDPSQVEQACRDIANKLDADYAETYKIILSGSRSQQNDQAFNQYEEILKSIKHFSIEELEKGIGYKTISAWTWSQLPPETVSEFIEIKKKYKNESSFRSSINTQIRNSFDKINDNFTQSSTKPIIYIHDRTLYLTDLIFKFYVNWK